MQTPTHRKTGPLSLASNPFIANKWGPENEHGGLAKVKRSESVPYEPNVVDESPLKKKHLLRKKTHQNRCNDMNHFHWTRPITFDNAISLYNSTCIAALKIHTLYNTWKYILDFTSHWHVVLPSRMTGDSSWKNTEVCSCCYYSIEGTIKFILRTTG